MEFLIDIYMEKFTSSLLFFVCLFVSILHDTEEDLEKRARMDWMYWEISENGYSTCTVFQGTVVRSHSNTKRISLLSYLRYCIISRASGQELEHVALPRLKPSLTNPYLEDYFYSGQCLSLGLLRAFLIVNDHNLRTSILALYRVPWNS